MSNLLYTVLYVFLGLLVFLCIIAFFIYACDYFRRVRESIQDLEKYDFDEKIEQRGGLVQEPDYMNNTMMMPANQNPEGVAMHPNQQYSEGIPTARNGSIVQGIATTRNGSIMHFNQQYAEGIPMTRSGSITHSNFTTQQAVMLPHGTMVGNKPPIMAKPSTLLTQNRQMPKRKAPPVPKARRK